MIERDDLKAAVGSGLLSEKQASGLITLADSRRGFREGLQPSDEPFELFKGFNEIFIVIGLGILSFGWSGVVALALGDEIIDLKNYAIMVASIGAVFLWLLSEYFIRKRRMVAPAIALAVLFAGNAAFGFLAVMTHPFMIAQNDYTSVPFPLLLATLSLLVFWWRFRVPFALAMIAVSLFATTIIFTASNSGPVEDVSDLFLLSADGPFAWITLLLGFAVFAVAMIFDMSDPHRVTRRSANGFWLHVVAAPALVNTLALSLLDEGTTTANAILLGVLTLFAVVAIIIDRRSFLIAAIGYIVVLAANILDGDGAALTVIGLGLVLLLLGEFWERIRGRLLRLMPRFVPLNRLPPSHLSKD